MNEHKARTFVAALNELCHQHGVMLWTSIHAIPIMATEVQKDDEFHYDIEKPEIGNSIIIRRVLK